MTTPQQSHPNDVDGNRKLEALRRLEEIVARLRGPNGCPWDREQTLASLSRNFLEEACEVIDAVERSDGTELASREVCEELGDLLMNVFLAARIAEEADQFDLAEVTDGICDKLIRRHPHVFGSETLDDSAAVLSRWDSIKAEEKRAAGTTEDSILDKVPLSLPPLASAFELGRRAARTGFDWDSVGDVLEKVREELAEVEECLHAGRNGAGEGLKQEIGDLLFAVVNLARKADLSPDEALRGTNRKFRRRFRYIEERMARADGPLTVAEMDRIWEEAKEREG